MKAAWLALVLGTALVAPAAADRADDDLAAVKKAVNGAAASETQAQARPPAERQPARATRAAEEEAPPAPRHRGAEPRWLRVRIVEKANKHGRVSVNLPLGIVRALGDDWEIHGCNRCESGHGLTLGQVLRALDSGQSLVEIDDEESTVRVWVD